MLTPHPLTGECVPPAFGAGGGHTRWVERGWGFNSSEDARHCSVLYICKYFVVLWLGPYTYRAQSLGPALLARTEAGCTQDWRMKKSYPLRYMRVIAISQIRLIMAPFHPWINYCLRIACHGGGRGPPT
jgi:hypothetical protein